jgi:hypothetical protein
MSDMSGLSFLFYFSLHLSSLPLLQRAACGCYYCVYDDDDDDDDDDGDPTHALSHAT